MVDREIERWCQEHAWSEPRQLEVGIWVAFPPGGVMETPLPSQVQRTKPRLWQDLVDLLLLLASTTIVLAIAIVISPLFIEPVVKYYRDRKIKEVED